MRYGLPDDRFQMIQKAFAIFPDIEKVVLYGSRALGTQRESSDIDLAFWGDFSLTRITEIYNVLESLPMAYKFDLTDYNAISHQGLKDHIDTHGIEIYRREEDKQS